MKRVIKLDISELKPGMCLAQTIFTGSHAILLESGQIVTAEHIKRLRNYAIRTVIVEDEATSSSDRLTPFHAVEQDDDPIARLRYIIREMPKKAGLEIPKAKLEEERHLHHRFETSHRELEETTWAAFQGLLYYDRLNMPYFRRTVEGLLAELEMNSNIRQAQTDLESDEDYLYMHSINVALYALTIGSAMKLAREELIELGISAMLHDIGMLKITRQIREKKKSLEKSEYEAIKNHSRYSREILEKFPQVSPRILNAITHHHERVDGSGYPSGLTRDDINLFSKIIAICDTFDSLSSSRPHRSALKKREALKECLKMCEQCFDENIVEKLLHNVPLYPVNTLIRLNNGEVGIVSHSTYNPFRPQVDIIQDAEGEPLQRKRRVNLSLGRNSALEISEIIKETPHKSVFA